jgi:hypothetical protein
MACPSLPVRLRRSNAPAEPSVLHDVLFIAKLVAANLCIYLIVVTAYACNDVLRLPRQMRPERARRRREPPVAGSRGPCARVDLLPGAGVVACLLHVAVGCACTPRRLACASPKLRESSHELIAE